MANRIFCFKMAYLAHCVWGILLLWSRVPEAERCFCGEPESAWAMLTGQLWKQCWGFLNNLHGDRFPCCPSEIMLELFFPHVSLSLSLWSHMPVNTGTWPLKIRFKKKKPCLCLHWPDGSVPSEWQSCWPGSSGACPSMLASALQCPGPAGTPDFQSVAWTASGEPRSPKLPMSCHMDDLWVLRFLLHAGRLTPHPVTACVCNLGGCGGKAASSLMNRPVSALMSVFRHHQGLEGALGRQGSTQGLGSFMLFSSCVLGFPVSIIF